MKARSRSRTLLSLAATLALGMAGPVAAQTTIGAGGGDVAQSWGKDNSQTYGQTITVPTDNVLTSFSFWLGRTSTNFPTPSEPSLSFMAYVYEWSTATSRATGPALYTSGLFTHNATPATPFTEYSFGTGGLSLTTGSVYALFLSTSGLAGSGRIQWEAPGSDAYSGGDFVFQNNGENTGLWTTSAWSTFSSAPDLRFEATFVGSSSVVPEPSTWIMLATGLLALGLVAMRRRRGNALTEA